MKMKKEEVKKEDGRLMYYYTFAEDEKNDNKEAKN